MRLNKDQYEKLKTNARERGFGHLSSYVRFMCLDADLVTALKVEEIHQILVGERRLSRKERKLRPRVHPDAIYSK